MRNTQGLLNDIAEMILDPLHREVEPKVGAKGYVRFFSQPNSINEQERTIRFRCSTNSVDRYSEIVDPQAFKKWLPVFETNPVMMAGHVYVAPDGMPTTIGNWRDLRITDDALEATAWFMENDALAEPYWQRYRKGCKKRYRLASSLMPLKCGKWSSTETSRECASLPM